MCRVIAKRVSSACFDIYGVTSSPRIDTFLVVEYDIGH